MIQSMLVPITFRIFGKVGLTFICLFFIGCTKTDCSTLSAGDYTCELEHDEMTRRYRVHVPDNLASGEVPLVVDFHGVFVNGLSQQLMSGYKQKSDEEGFVVAWPEGSTGWLGRQFYNANFCCDMKKSNVDDLGFVRRLVDEIMLSASIDKDKIFATGLSNGGSMSYHMYCDAADLFAAVAPISYVLGRDQVCQPERAIPLISFNTPQDTIVPYQGGYMGFPSSATGFFDRLMPWADRHLDLPVTYDLVGKGVEETIAVIADLNHCSEESIETYSNGGSFCYAFLGCEDDATISYCLIDGRRQPLGGHAAYFNADKVNIADLSWAFFMKVTMDN